MLIGDRRLVGLIAVAGTLAALAFPAQSLAEADLVDVDLHVSGQGRIAATIEHAADGEDADVVCDGSVIVPATSMAQTTRCPQRYRRDRVVTLRAEPVGASEFDSWSDDRCPRAPVCKLVVDSKAQAVVATFSRQQVVVAVANNSFDPARITGTLSSAPPNTPPVPLTCDPPAPGAAPGELSAGARRLCHGEFPLGSEVRLGAEGVTPTWGSGQRGDACDAIVGAGCSLTLQFKRIVALNFGVLPPVNPYGTVTSPNDIGVVFHVAKNRTGSGTVRSDGLDCGDRCEAKLRFGASRTLVADAKPGSRFVRWRGACAGSPRCTLAVGPVTRVTAVFDTAGDSPVKPSGAKAPSKRQGSRSPFAARVGRRPVVRGTRPRRILFSVAVNARSSIRAVLAKAHGRAVTSRSWEVRPGIRALELRVPDRARRGTYVLRITARDGAGAVKRFQRRVRLRR